HPLRLLLLLLKPHPLLLLKLHPLRLLLKLLLLLLQSKKPGKLIKSRRKSAFLFSAFLPASQAISRQSRPCSCVATAT
ncbi:MAG TPA: hypothetical protein VKO66_05805, partial [Sideroxyarcus sp.]|nr:hypothetical protein [Sideroxyarcus sp.]